MDLVALATVGVAAALAIWNSGRTKKWFPAFIKAVRADPSLRAKVYRRWIGRMWLSVSVVPLVVFISPSLTFGGIGVAWPKADLAGFLLAGYLLLLSLISIVRVRHKFARGEEVPARAGLAPLIPRSATEKWLAAGLSASAGITEEFIYRGLFTGTGIYLLGLHPVLAGLTGLAVFVAVHAYQGQAGLLGSGIIGGLLTAIYLFTGSLLLPIVLHTAHDLFAFLLAPPGPVKPAATTA
jgi:membrane protease YdiL (CAAX protease family)